MGEKSCVGDIDGERLLQRRRAEEKGSSSSRRLASQTDHFTDAFE
ncbi:hypothetical protein [Caballeronia sp. NK8]|nr:hypothetical protein [Caballeronia sp. NK8]